MVLCDSTGHLLPAAFVSPPSSWAGFLPLTAASLLSISSNYHLDHFSTAVFPVFCEPLEDVASSGSNQLPLKTNHLIQSMVVKFNDSPLYPLMERDCILLCQKMLN